MDKSDLEQKREEYALWINTTFENRILDIYIHNKARSLLSKLIRRKVSTFFTGFICSVFVLVVCIVISIIIEQPYIPIIYHLLIVAIVAGFTPIIAKIGSRKSNQLFLELTDYIADEEVLVLSKRWVTKVYSPAKQIIASILFVVLGVIIVKILEIGDSSVPIYVSSYIAVAFASFVMGNGIYLVFTTPSLVFPVRNCRFILFPLSPADSPLIAKSVSAFSKLIFGYALGFSLVLIELYYLNPFSSEATMQIALGTLIFGLFLISYSFLLPNYFLSQIIKNEKTRILKDLQCRIMELYAAPQLLDGKKTNDIKAITDIYDKVKASRENPIRFSGFRNYITSLLLPILSFLSGFVDWKIDISSWLN